MTATKETRVLTIEGDLLRVQRTIIEREVKTSDFIAEIARTQPLDTGPLPHSCVWHCRREAERNKIVSVYVIERPAGMQKIRLKTSAATADEEVIKDLALSWPMTLWFVRCMGEAIQDLYLACIKAPVAEDGRDAALHCLLMPNQHDHGQGQVCLGNLIVKDGLPLARRIEDLMRETLESLWNSDLMPSFEGSGISGLENWAEHSAVNSEFHTQIAFPEHRRQTVGGMLAWLLENPE
ncbi:MAG: hypothetical protein ABSE73_08485 [Planctomycetota bacterium]